MESYNSWKDRANTALNYKLGVFDDQIRGRAMRSGRQPATCRNSLAFPCLQQGHAMPLHAKWKSRAVALNEWLHAWSVALSSSGYSSNSGTPGRKCRYDRAMGSIVIGHSSSAEGSDSSIDRHRLLVSLRARNRIVVPPSSPAGSRIAFLPVEEGGGLSFFRGAAGGGGGPAAGEGGEEEEASRLAEAGTGTTSSNLWRGARWRRTRDEATEGILDDRGSRAERALLISERGARRPWPEISNGDTCAP